MFIPKNALASKYVDVKLASVANIRYDGIVVCVGCDKALRVTDIVKTNITTKSKISEKLHTLNNSNFERGFAA